MTFRPSHEDAMTRRLRKNRVLTCLLLFTVPTLLVASVAWAFEETEGGAGLQGILPFEAPDDLTAEAFLVLSGNWQEWSAEVAEIVTGLYEAEDLDIEGQRGLLAALNSKLRVMDAAIADAAYRSIHDELISVHGKLKRRVDLAEAILDTLELDPEVVKAERINAAGMNVLGALDGLEAYLDSIPKGADWLPYLRAENLRYSISEPTAGDDPSVVAAGVQQKLNAGNTVPTEQQRMFLGRPPFLALEQAISAYLAIYHAEPKAIDEVAVRAKLAQLVELIENFEADSRIGDAGRVHATLAELAEFLPDGGDRIRGVVRASYQNYNLQVVASEGFLSRVIHERRSESGHVRDFVLGASVYGHQWTNTEVGVDVKRSNANATFNVTLTGQTQTNTSGVTSQATIYTNGNHHFWASKEVDFDGFLFTTKPARISVNANNRTVGASTNFDGWPLLGAIGRGIAKNEARKREGQSESITRSRIAQRVIPEFNKEVDNNFHEANDRLQNNLNKRLKEAGVYPQATIARTSDTHLRLSSQVMADGELGGAVPNSSLDRPHGVTIHMHETLLNNSADRMNFAGRTMTDDEIRAEIEAFLTKLTGEEYKIEPSKDDESGADKGPDTLIFAAEDPIRLKVQDGYVNLIIRAGFLQEGKEDIPTQEVTVPLHYRVEGDQIVIERGNVKVSPVDRPQSAARQIAHAGVIRKKIQSSIPDRTRDRTVMMEREGKESLPVYINDIKALNGWVTVWAE